MVERPSEGIDHIVADKALCLALVADLDAGFAEVVRAHERVVHSVALRLSSRPADAEDLAAESFLRAYRALRGYDQARIRALRLRPWLLTILRNTARNAARDASRRPAPPPAFEPVEEHNPGPGVEQQAEQGDVQRELGALLTHLPDVQRLAVVLRHGLSDFERAVLAATSRVPAGQTRPYGWIAHEPGRRGRSDRCWLATRCRCWSRATASCARTAG